MAIINTRPGRIKGNKALNTHGIQPDWKRDKPSTNGTTAALGEAPDGANNEEEPVVRFGGIVSDDEDGEVERSAIESRGGRKFIKVEYHQFI